ncbi:MAG: hypothetical protein WD810_01785 [Solirubrobacterales bacterium]
MPHFSESIQIERPPEEVWREIGAPEHWLEGYVEVSSRSADYPARDTRDDAPGAPLGGAFGVAVSPDGRSVYVASEGSDSIAHFLRELAPPPADDPGVAGGGGGTLAAFGAKTQVTLRLAAKRVPAKGPPAPAGSRYRRSPEPQPAADRHREAVPEGSRD